MKNKEGGARFVAKVELKQPIVQEISEQIKDAQSVVVVDYRGLTVAEDTQLRKQLREAGVAYKVYKNTLVNFAIKGTDFESLSDVLEGPNAFAISTTDATAPARVIAKFAKTAPALEIKAGVVEGTFYDADGMKAIATIPSREELLSKFLGSIQSPITNLPVGFIYIFVFSSIIPSGIISFITYSFMSFFNLSISILSKC